MEKDERVLVLRRIHVTYHLKLNPEQRAAAERAHALHIDFCPVARTVKGCIEITTSLELEDLQPTEAQGG